MQLGRRTLGVVAALLLVGSVPTGKLGHSRHQVEAEAVVAAAFAAMANVDSYRLTTRRTTAMGKATSSVVDEAFVDVRGGRRLVVHDDGRESRIIDGVIYSEVGPSTADEVDTAWIAYQIPDPDVGSGTESEWASFDPQRARPIFVARAAHHPPVATRELLRAGADQEAIERSLSPADETYNPFREHSPSPRRGAVSGGSGKGP